MLYSAVVFKRMGEYRSGRRNFLSSPTFAAAKTSEDARDIAAKILI